MSATRVTDAIREEILANELAPGQRLVESELCERFGASRRGVRDALAALDHEGLVERIANRGARVRVISAEEAIENAEVRLAVERLCVARAAERATDADKCELRQFGKRFKDAAQSGDAAAFAQTTTALFDAYIRISGHAAARDVLDRLRRQNSRFNFRVTFTPGWMQTALPCRLALIDGICGNDPEAAVAALERHTANVMAGMHDLSDGKGRIIYAD